MIDNDEKGNYFINNSPGEKKLPVTLRDYFAGLAMQGYIISDNEIKISDDILAVYAYTLADEMLRCREGE
jgi:hypothetical protein